MQFLFTFLFLSFLPFGYAAVSFFGGSMPVAVMQGVVYTALQNELNHNDKVFCAFPSDRYAKATTTGGEHLNSLFSPNNKRMNEKKVSTGAFVASVLLSQNEWDIKKLISDCKADWNMDIPYDNNAEMLVAFMGDITLAVTIMPTPVPNQEAEHYAKANYMWKDAVEMTKSHKAHILVSVLGKDAGLFEKGKLFTKVVSSCLKQKGAIAVYTDGAVFEPRFYCDAASVMQQDDDVLPILDWVWFGVYQTKEYAGIYTYGMRKFGKEEMEVYAENADLNDVRNFLLEIVTYVLDCDVTLKDGETIGFSEDQKLDITLSDAIALEGKSLKIKYPK